MQEPEKQSIGEEATRAIDQAASDLHVILPNGIAPKPFKLIALASLVGGIGIIGSLMVDIVRPDVVSTFLYFLRLIFGFCAVVVAYGLSRRESWSVWLYGAMGIVSFLINPVFAIIPGLVVVYLFLHRRFLKASALEARIAKWFRHFGVKVEKTWKSVAKKGRMEPVQGKDS